MMERIKSQCICIAGWARSGKPIRFYWPVIAPMVILFMILLMVVGNAQSQTGIVPLVTNDPVGEYIARGGSAAIILIMSYFYRRDMLAYGEFWKDNAKVHMDLIQQITKAQADNTAATHETVLVVQQLSSQLYAMKLLTDGRIVGK